MDERIFNAQTENEARFSAAQLLEEITSLLEDYFICRTELTKGGVNLTFLNNQQFRLVASEIA
ncbi:MAG: hypothetical protein HDP34_00210 [Clostridia bacterium]|nr:hypothetical protein [Clostridia bacterium]